MYVLSGCTRRRYACMMYSELGTKLRECVLGDRDERDREMRVGDAEIEGLIHLSGALLPSVREKVPSCRQRTGTLALFLKLAFCCV